MTLPPMRAPLSAEHKHAATRIGALAYGLWYLGWQLFSTGFVVLVVGLLLGGVFGIVEAADAAPLLSTTLDYIGDPGLWVGLLVAAMLVGVALLGVAVYSSGRRLAARGVVRPWGVTWAALGVSVVTGTVVGWIVGIPFSLLKWLIPGVGTVVFGSIEFLLGLATAVTLGWFAWWWMAHLLRARQ